jgi:hypothetical protein
MDITERSLELFLELARDAGNWSGTPILAGSASDRGNVTQLKKAGLITTITDRGETFACFTPAGQCLAAEHDIAVEVV